MKLNNIVLTAFILLVGGCATTTPSPTIFNISNTAMPTHGSSGLKTYSDYGRGIKYNEQAQSRQLTVFTGGTAGCDNGAIAYAKTKLDKYMKENNYLSYKVLRGQYTLLPLSKCHLYIKFKKLDT